MTTKMTAGTVSKLMENATFGEVFRMLRKLRGIKMQEVTTTVGLTSQAIYKIEEGNFLPKNIDTALKFAELVQADKQEMVELLIEGKITKSKERHEKTLRHLATTLKVQAKNHGLNIEKKLKSFGI